jgi:DNA/RNA-binding domain of Phe-tRNA-synthetase-like protein
MVDINNLVSLETGCPVGSYHLGKLVSPFVFHIGEEGEKYQDEYTYIHYLIRRNLI